MARRPATEDPALTAPAPHLGSVHNLRDAADLGGACAEGGRRVRHGVLYRSAGLAALAPGDEAAFASLGLRAVFDLRMAGEQAEAPDRLPDGIRHVPVDVLAEWGSSGQPMAFASWFEDPDLAHRALGGGRAQALWEDQYRAFVRLDGARAAYARLYRELAEGAARPALVHCTTGKDRTGWAVASIQLFLGVPPDAVMAHFLVSRERIGPLVEPVLAGLAARGGDPELFRPIFDVRPSYLEAALDEVRASFGSIDRYVADGLGVDAATAEALREAFLA